MELDYEAGRTSNTIDCVFSNLLFAVEWLVELISRSLPKNIVTRGSREVLAVLSQSESVLKHYRTTTSICVLHNVHSYVPRLCDGEHDF